MSGTFQRLVFTFWAIDFNNVVYSFGLVFGILIFLTPFVPQLSNFLQRLTRPVQPYEVDDADIKQVRWVGRLVALIAVVIGFTITTVIYAYDVQFFLNDYFLTLALFIASTFAGVIAFWSHREGESSIFVMLGESNISQMLGAVAFLAAFVYFLGRAVADYQMFYSDLYTIWTKDETHKPIEKVHIVRSSSNGFILSENGKTIFIPQAEIRKIEAVK
jgi:hypothetical protein